MKRKPSLEKNVKCPYLIDVYTDRIYCEAPMILKAKLVSVVFNNSDKMVRFLNEECGKFECEKCPNRRVLDEQYTKKD